MKVIAIKMSVDPQTCRIAYEKDGKLYVRNGNNGFTVGVEVQSPIKALLNKWGFLQVENPPSLKNGKEISQNLDKFEMKSNGKVTYSR